MMLRCLQSLEELTGNNGTDMTALERQRMRLIWLQQQQLGQQQNPLMQNYPIELNQTPQFIFLNKNDFGNFPITRSDEMGISSSEIVVEEKRVDSSFTAKTKKRKAEFCETEDYKDERIKEDIEEVESKVTEKSIKESSAGTFKENSSKASEVPKPDYIHVRARRGQATDSHSLAERARREKISKKMKCLQDLVPGCNKITGKAGMLDEIINYVQSLQRQVEFLSMKLGALSPRLDFNTDNLFAKEFPAYVANFPSEMGNLASLQLNGLQQEASPSCLLDVSVNPQEIAAAQINRSPSLSIPEMYHETSCNSQVQIQPFSAWDTELQSLYNLEFH